MTQPVVVETVKPSKAKTFVAIAGGILSAIIPLILSIITYLPPQWAAVITAVIGLLTAFGVYSVPYKPKESIIVHNKDIAAINAGTAIVPESGAVEQVSDDYKDPWAE